MTNPAGYNTGIIKDADGNMDVHAEIDIKTATGGVLKIDGTDVSAGLQEIATIGGLTSTALELNELDGMTSRAQSTVAVAAESGNAIAVTITLKDAAGAAISDARPVRAWLSSSATTGAVATDDTITVTATTGLLLTEIVDDLIFDAITHTNGVLVLSVAHAGDATAKYLWVETAGFHKPKISAVIDLA